MKKRILFCSEATFLNTGYAIYTKEVLKYLHGTGKYEIAELASYGEKNDPRGMSCPWKYYGVMPNSQFEPKASKEEQDAYHANPSNQFGMWAFEAVCLDFMPDIVCVPPETLIHTENGYKQIKEIKVGQKVMSHKGIYQSVTKTMRRQHVGDIIKIKAGGDSQYMQLTEEHPVYAYRKRRQTNQKKSYKDIYDGICPEFIPAKDIKVGDLVILPKNNSANISSEIDITNYLSNFIIKNDKIYPTKITNCNPINKNCLLNYELGVLIGYIIGDGSINQGSVCVTFNAHEINFAEDCAKLFCNIFGIPASLNLIEAKNCINVTCNSVLLSEFLEKFIGKKEDKHICAELFNSSISTKQGLLKGLFRSDGCYGSNTVSFTSKMQHLAYEVRQICVDLNIPVSIHKSSKAYSVEGYGESARLLHEIVQKFDINKLELCENPTRRPRTTHIINGHMVAAVQRVRKENYTGQVYNLEVDVDNSYVTNWCVHNCDIRDFWMMSHEETSPFRPFYHLVWMPTVDAYPQSRQWIASYAQCDACFTYSNWAGQILTEQSGGKIKWRGSAPPCAGSEFQPIWDKDSHKQSYGIDPNFKIIGTVMRNQRRKLYPDLFAAFRKFLDQSEDKRFYLYCHTSYPDLGWDIPELLQEHNLSSHVLFTYICNETGKFFPSLFRGPIAQSPYTGRWGATLSNVKRGLNNQDLAKVYNFFDLYVQYANCEGFGIPMVEAASCGVPIMGTDYSAMESVIRELGGYPIKPKALYKELETGCMRAVPDNDLACSMFKEFFTLSKEQRLRLAENTKKLCDEDFNIQKTGKQWEECFDELPKRPLEQTWKSPARIKQSAQKPDASKETDFHNLAKWLIVNVLCEPERLNTFMESRLARDLMYRSSTANVGGLYFNESSAVFDGLNFRHDFNFDMAYEQMRQMCDRRNQWEQVRMNKIQGNK